MLFFLFGGGRTRSGGIYSHWQSSAGGGSYPSLPRMDQLTSIYRPHRSIAGHHETTCCTDPRYRFYHQYRRAGRFVLPKLDVVHQPGYNAGMSGRYQSTATDSHAFRRRRLPQERTPKGVNAGAMEMNDQTSGRHQERPNPPKRGPVILPGNIRRQNAGQRTGNTRMPTGSP